MFKLTLISMLLLVSISLFADENRTKMSATKVTLGLGIYNQTQPYSGLDPILVPTPVIFFDNSLFYIRWTRFGIYFMGNSSDTFSWGASLTAQPRANGYVPQKNSIVADMSERETSFEGGLSLACSYKFNKNSTLFAEVLNLHDILDKSNGSITRAEIGAKLFIENWSFYPSILAIYHSSNFNNYYFGVQENETTSSRASYRVGADIDYALQSYINYEINPKYSILTNIRSDKLAAKVTASPIVTQKYFYSGMVSLIYTFTL